jgi:hypothetical protein
MEDDFENSGLRFYQRRVANPLTIFKTFKKGGIVVPSVVSSLFKSNDAVSVATVLLDVSEDQKHVVLYNPFTNQEEEYLTTDYLESWKDAQGECTTAFEKDETYNPKFLDLKHVELPDFMDELCEAIAENAHDTWAWERQSEGWTYGPVRDDENLQTPDMVPYAELPDSERQYDRVMAFDTLRLLIALGYKIEKRD